jgi:hypothetical protein
MHPTEKNPVIGPNAARPVDKAWYEIRVRGHLDAHWGDWLEGLTIANNPDGTTTLSMVVGDQARLHGVLGRIGALGMTLISLNPIGDPAQSE